MGAAQAELAKQKKLVKLYYQVFCTPQRWKAQEAVRTEEKKIADLDKRIEEAKKALTPHAQDHQDADEPKGPCAMFQLAKMLAGEQDAVAGAESDAELDRLCRLTDKISVD